MNVLIACNEPKTLRRLADDITEIGHRAIEATDGPQAFKALRSFKPELSLIDIDSNLTWGLALVHIARKKTPGALIAAITNYPNRTRARQSLSMGADMICDKAALFSLSPQSQSGSIAERMEYTAP